jgi:hypothetical protein
MKSLSVQVHLQNLIQVKAASGALPDQQTAGLQGNKFKQIL